MKQKLILVRGLPGSGKTTYAKAIARDTPDSDHIEADWFFCQNWGYEFEPAKLKYAHDWCRGETSIVLQGGYTAIVSNTFTQMWDMDKYIQLAVDFGVELEVVEIKTQFNNIHGVPEEKLQQMKNRWEELPPDFPYKVTRIV